MANDFDFPKERYLLVGKIGKPHGVRGEMKLMCVSNEPGTLADYAELVLIDDRNRLSVPLEVEKVRWQGKSTVIKFAGIDDRVRAESLQGTGVLVDKALLPDTGEEEYYWHQFIGLPVTVDQGKLLGTVTSMFSNGAQDILVVTQGEREYLIPVLPSTIKEHTQEGVVITPPPGLLDVNTGVDE